MSGGGGHLGWLVGPASEPGKANRIGSEREPAADIFCLNVPRGLSTLPVFADATRLGQTGACGFPNTLPVSSKRESLCDPGVCACFSRGRCEQENISAKQSPEPTDRAQIETNYFRGRSAVLKAPVGGWTMLRTGEPIGGRVPQCFLFYFILFYYLVARTPDESRAEQGMQRREPLRDMGDRGVAGPKASGAVRATLSRGHGERGDGMSRPSGSSASAINPRVRCSPLSTCRSLARVRGDQTCMFLIFVIFSVSLWPFLRGRGLAAERGIRFRWQGNVFAGCAWATMGI